MRQHTNQRHELGIAVQRSVVADRASARCPGAKQLRAEDIATGRPNILASAQDGWNVSHVVAYLGWATHAIAEASR